jgi:hypothetical protein
MVIRSYVRSTDDHCESRSEYIFSSIDIPINAFSVATRTIPSADIQRHFSHYEPAMVTSFTAREKSVNFDQGSPVPIAFILKLTKHFAPSSIANTVGFYVGSFPHKTRRTTSQLTITNHVSDGKILNSNYAIVSNQISGQFMQKISTSIFDFGVYLSYFKSRFRSVIRAFGFPTQQLLRHFKLLIQPIKMLWIGYLLSIAGSQQTRNTNVNPNLFFRWWQWLNSWVIHQQRNKPSTLFFQPVRRLEVCL